MMLNIKKSSAWINALQQSLLMTMIFNSAFVLLKEMSPAFKDFLSILLFNSWLAQLTLITLFFFLLFLILGFFPIHNKSEFTRNYPWVLGISLLSIMIIFVLGLGS